MLTSAVVSFVSCLDACLEAVGVRPSLQRDRVIVKRGNTYCDAIFSPDLSQIGLMIQKNSIATPR
jgi:hypothetical protein